MWSYMLYLVCPQLLHCFYNLAQQWKALLLCSFCLYTFAFCLLMYLMNCLICSIYFYTLQHIKLHKLDVHLYELSIIWILSIDFWVWGNIDKGLIYTEGMDGVSLLSYYHNKIKVKYHFWCCFVMCFKFDQ